MAMTQQMDAAWGVMWKGQCLECYGGKHEDPVPAYCTCAQCKYESEIERVCIDCMVADAMWTWICISTQYGICKDIRKLVLEKILVTANASVWKNPIGEVYPNYSRYLYGYRDESCCNDEHYYWDNDKAVNGAWDEDEYDEDGLLLDDYYASPEGRLDAEWWVCY